MIQRYFHYWKIKHLLYEQYQIILNELLELWKEKMISSTYISFFRTQFTDLPPYKQYIIGNYLSDLMDVSYQYQNILDTEFKYTKKISIEHRDIQAFIPSLHPYYHCLKDPLYVFDNVSVSYPTKIRRIIQMCIHNERECIWNLLQKIIEKEDWQIAALILSFVEKWQNDTYSILIRIIDPLAITKITPYLITDTSQEAKQPDQQTILLNKLALVPVSSDIKQSWNSTLYSLSNSNSDTYHKYKSYFESIVQIPFNVYHSITIPNKSFITEYNSFLKDVSSNIDVQFAQIDSNSYGLIGSLESWKQCKSRIRSLRYDQLKKMKKRELNRLKRELNLTTDFHSIDPIETLNPSIQTQYKSLDDRYRDTSNWIKNYLQESRKKMDSVIYGMEEAKQFVLNQVTNWLNKGQKGLVFGLCGPPGVGKTTFVRNAIAPCFRDETGKPRPVITIGLGGKVSGSSLKGHSFTYVGSKFGQIVQGLIQSKCMNPIFYFDELDKVSQTAQGNEINSILMQITDFSQNHEYEDAYFHEFKFDLRKCIFIFSYNRVEQIDSILMNRIQEIELKPFILQEKIYILKHYTIPQLMKDYGLSPELSTIWSDSILANIVLKYTYEPGIRLAQIIISQLISHLCYDYSVNTNTVSLYDHSKHMLENNLDTILEHKVETKFTLPWKTHRVGHIIGLYASSSGTGGILPIESIITAKSKDSETSGNLKQVIQESIKLAKHVALSFCELKEDDVPSIYIHCNNGGVAKDGPSAGVAFFLLHWSQYTKIKLPYNWAFTGEITMRGDIDPVGGIIQKFFAAITYGIKVVCAPANNKNDWQVYLNSLDKTIRKEICGLIKIHWVKNIKQVITLLQKRR